MNREEAIERIKTRFDKWALDNEDTKAIQTLIPELAESKDERIRKGLIEALKTSKTVGELKFILPELTREEAIAYLEKQKELYNQADWNEYKDKPVEVWNAYIKGKAVGIKIGEQKEQKPVEWSEEDEERLKEILSYLIVGALPSIDRRKACVDWLKSRRPQQKDILPSLSEKEIICLKRALDYLRKEHNRYGGEDFTNEIAVLEWLITHPTLVYSFQLSWKPSEEQMNFLLRLEGELRADNHPVAAKTLAEIYEQLKAL